MWGWKSPGITHGTCGLKHALEGAQLLVCLDLTHLLCFLSYPHPWSPTSSCFDHFGWHALASTFLSCLGCKGDRSSRQGYKEVKGMDRRIFFHFIYNRKQQWRRHCRLPPHQDFTTTSFEPPPAAWITSMTSDCGYKYLQIWVPQMSEKSTTSSNSTHLRAKHTHSYSFSQNRSGILLFEVPANVLRGNKWKRCVQLFIFNLIKQNTTFSVLFNILL